MNKKQSTSCKVAVQRSTYGTSPVTHRRRTKLELDQLHAATEHILADEDDQMTIRHLFYRLVGMKVIEKTKADYKSLCCHLSKWRRADRIPWTAFNDNTRWRYGIETYDSVEAALHNTIES